MHDKNNYTGNFPSYSSSEPFFFFFPLCYDMHKEGFLGDRKQLLQNNGTICHCIKSFKICICMNLSVLYSPKPYFYLDGISSENKNKWVFSTSCKPFLMLLLYIFSWCHPSETNLSINSGCALHFLPSHSPWETLGEFSNMMKYFLVQDDKEQNLFCFLTLMQQGHRRADSLQIIQKPL